MKKIIIVGAIVGFLISFSLGFFVGREYLRHEIKKSYQEVTEKMADRYLQYQEEELEKIKQEAKENYDKAMEEYEQALVEQEEGGEFRFWVTPPVALPVE